VEVDFERLCKILLPTTLKTLQNITMPEAVSIQFTVGKLDAGVGILISPENHISMLSEILYRFLFFLNSRISIIHVT
jgi:hypothetical protein